MESGKKIECDLIRCSNGPDLFAVDFSLVAFVEKGYGSTEYKLLMKNLHFKY